MNTYTVCPCCSNTLLHHFADHREYWFCRHCWAEMPSLETVCQQNDRAISVVNLSARLPIQKQILVAI